MNDINITTVTTPAPDADKGPKKIDLLDNRMMGAVGLRVDSAQVQGWKEKIRELLKNGLDGERWQDADFMDDVRQATLQGAHPAALLFFWTLITFLAVFFVWAGLAPLDEVTHGQGTVIPSGKVQEVGSTEGGVVAEIFVKAGDIVQPSQTLVRLDDTMAAAGVGEKEARRYYLQAQMIRLNAELGAKTGDSDADAANGDISNTVVALDKVDAAGNPVFPDDMKQKVPQIVADAQRQFESRKAELESTTGVLKERAQQRREEATDARHKAASLAQSYQLAKQELDMTQPYLEKGAVSKMDILKLQTSVVDAQKELNTAQQGIPAAEAALREAQNALDEGVLKFKNEDHDELAKAKDEYARLGQSVKGDENRAERTVLRSPIRAEVKQLMVNTVGQAVQPGANIVELVPLEEKLLVEAKLKPQDVAFIRPGMKAMVKLSAYDFSIYGGLPAKVESISPDSFTETEGGHQVTYFKINVRTDRNYLAHNGKKLAISSGMVATVDVLTGQRTVLQYLLKPINKARENAFSER